MIKNLEKVTVYVNSQVEAKKFWIEKMGFALKVEQPMGPNAVWIEVAPEGENKTTLILYSKELMKQQHPDAVAHPSLMFSTENIEELWNKLKMNGVEVLEIQSFPYGKMFEFKDNDGNRYLIRQ